MHRLPFYAAVLALSFGSTVYADLVLSEKLVQNGDGTETVTFYLSHFGPDNRTRLAGMDLAIYAPTTGLYISTDHTTTPTSGSPVITSGSESYINSPPGWAAVSQTVLTLDGHLDSGLNGVYSDGDRAAGIAGFFEGTQDVDLTAPFTLANVIVPANGTVRLLQSTPGGGVGGTRTIVTDFEPNGTEFISDTAAFTPNYLTVAAVNNITVPFPFLPEPSTLGTTALAATFLVRRRRLAS